MTCTRRRGRYFSTKAFVGIGNAMVDRCAWNPRKTRRAGPGDRRGWTLYGPDQELNREPTTVPEPEKTTQEISPDDLDFNDPIELFADLIVAPDPVAVAKAIGAAPWGGWESAFAAATPPEIASYAPAQGESSY